MRKKESLQIEYPEIAKEWHPSRNGTCLPNMVTPYSGKKVWWLGECGHEWQATVANRSAGTGCPFCANKRVLTGYNDLAALHPEVAAEWDYERNGELTPNNILAGSHKTVYWKCGKGHSWKATVKDRINGHGCPKCTQKTSFPEQAIFYYTQQHFPDVVNGDKSIGVELDIYIPSKKVAIEYDGYWFHKSSTEKDSRKDATCQRKNIQLIRIREQGLKNTAIAYSIFRNDASSNSLNIAIVTLLEYLGIKNPDVCVDRDYIGIVTQYNTQIHAQSLLVKYPEIAAEWHPTKNGALTPLDITSRSSRARVWWLGRCGHEWQAIVESRTKGAGCPYCSNQKVLIGFNDFATNNPELVQEWHPTKNEGLSPYNIVTGSTRKIWWKCHVCEYEWQNTPRNRGIGGQGCPYCHGKRFWKGHNDLLSLKPDLVGEWDFVKNGELRPDQIHAGSKKKVWWIGECGHEWQATVDSRVRGSGCPKCGNTKGHILSLVNKLKEGDNSFGKKKLEGAKLWNYQRNGSLTPFDVLPFSSKKVWWLCEKGHEWQTTVASVSSGNGCPVCSSRIVLQGINDLETTHPRLASEWHPTKNGQITAQMVSFGSVQKAWWLCKYGHEWEASPNSRSKGNGCPYCSNKRVLSGYNDLATINPELAKEWHPSLNGELTAHNVSVGSSKKVWWLGKCGHEWNDTVFHRNDGRKCPYCSGKRVLAGFNDLATEYPLITEEWDYERNNGILPTAVSRGSKQLVWWKCSNCGTSYQTSVNNRTRGFRCPNCGINTAVKSLKKEHTIEHE